MRKIRLIGLWGILLFLSIIIIIWAINKIERTNLENKLFEEQKYYIENFISKKSDSKTTIDLLKTFSTWVESKDEIIVPNVSFYGKDNDNYLVLYVKEDDNQKQTYKAELNKIISKIEENDTFNIVAKYDEDNEYVVEIVIEYNY